MGSYRKFKKKAQEGIVDQYGNPVPDDLVLLPTSSEFIKILTEEEIKKIDDADWYEIEGMLFVPNSQVGDIVMSDAGPEEFDIDLVAEEVNYINPPLHRFSEEDGFYHA